MSILGEEESVLELLEQKPSLERSLTAGMLLLRQISLGSQDEHSVEAFLKRCLLPTQPIMLRCMCYSIIRSLGMLYSSEVRDMIVKSIIQDIEKGAKKVIVAALETIPYLCIDDISLIITREMDLLRLLTLPELVIRKATVRLMTALLANTPSILVMAASFKPAWILLSSDLCSENDEINITAFIAFGKLFQEMRNPSSLSKLQQELGIYPHEILQSLQAELVRLLVPRSRAIFTRFASLKNHHIPYAIPVLVELLVFLLRMNTLEDSEDPLWFSFDLMITFLLPLFQSLDCHVVYVLGREMVYLFQVHYHVLASFSWWMDEAVRGLLVVMQTHDGLSLMPTAHCLIDALQYVSISNLSDTLGDLYGLLSSCRDEQLVVELLCKTASIALGRVMEYVRDYPEENRLVGSVFKLFKFKLNSKHSILSTSLESNAVYQYYCTAAHTLGIICFHALSSDLERFSEWLDVCVRYVSTMRFIFLNGYKKIYARHTPAYIQFLHFYLRLFDRLLRIYESREGKAATEGLSRLDAVLTSLVSSTACFPRFPVDAQVKICTMLSSRVREKVAAPMVDSLVQEIGGVIDTLLSVDYAIPIQQGVFSWGEYDASRAASRVLYGLPEDDVSQPEGVPTSAGDMGVRVCLLEALLKCLVVVNMHHGSASSGVLSILKRLSAHPYLSDAPECRERVKAAMIEREYVLRVGHGAAPGVDPEGLVKKRQVGEGYYELLGRGDTMIPIPLNRSHSAACARRIRAMVRAMARVIPGMCDEVRMAVPVGQWGEESDLVVVEEPVTLTASSDAVKVLLMCRKDARTKQVTFEIEATNVTRITLEQVSLQVVWSGPLVLTVGRARLTTSLSPGERVHQLVTMEVQNTTRCQVGVEVAVAMYSPPDMLLFEGSGGGGGGDQLAYRPIHCTPYVLGIHSFIYPLHVGNEAFRMIWDELGCTQSMIVSHKGIDLLEYLNRRVWYGESWSYQGGAKHHMRISSLTWYEEPILCSISSVAKEACGDTYSTLEFRFVSPSIVHSWEKGLGEDLIMGIFTCPRHAIQVVSNEVHILKESELSSAVEPSASTALDIWSSLIELRDIYQ